MAVVDVLNINAEKVSEVELPDHIFNTPVKTSVLYEVVKMQLAGKRSGTAMVKNRSDVKGSRKKLFRQKGTGRARRGNITSPLLRGGGVVFGPHPRSYAYKVPKKVRRLALKMALSSKLQDQQIMILDQCQLEAIKTKSFMETLKSLNIRNGLFITDAENRNLELSARNVQAVKVLRSEGLNVYDILKYERLVILAPSLKQIEGRLGS